MTRRFVKNVLGLLPGYRHVSNIFYSSPAGDVLYGYAYSRQSSGIQCYLCILPLYVSMEFLHLGFSIYLPNPFGYISVTNALEKKFLGRGGKYSSPGDVGVASDFVRACLDFKAENFRYEENVDGFVQMLLDRSQPNYSGPLGPLMVDASMRLYSLAASLVLKGERSLAAADLEMIFRKAEFDKQLETETQVYTLDLRHEKEALVKLQSDMVQDRDIVVDDAKQLYHLLDTGINAAQEWLKEVEEKNKMLFKIK